MDRELTCERIVDNISNIEGELAELRETWRREQSDLERLRQRRDDALRESNDPSSVIGRMPRRRDPVGIGTDIISAIGQVLTDESIQKIKDLETQISETEAKIDSTENKIHHQLEILQHQQGQFNRYRCFDLGFSHEVLNVRSCSSGDALE